VSAAVRFKAPTIQAWLYPAQTVAFPGPSLWLFVAQTVALHGLSRGHIWPRLWLYPARIVAFCGLPCGLIRPASWLFLARFVVLSGPASEGKSALPLYSHSHSRISCSCILPGSLPFSRLFLSKFNEMKHVDRHALFLFAPEPDQFSCRAFRKKGAGTKPAHKGEWLPSLKT